MSLDIVVALIGAGVGILTSVITAFYGPAWKDRLDRQRQRSKRSEFLLARYSEPLARAAFDLQSRLYNLARRSVQPSIDTMSTLWLFGQYLAWVEIVRREVQVLDMGDVARTSQLQQHLFNISDTLATTQNIQDAAFNVVRAEQRAIGEVMVVERRVGGQERSDCMGFATFTDRMQDPKFGNWFQGLTASVGIVAGAVEDHPRPILLQQALIDLIDFLDPNRVRFPDPNERGKIPLPPGTADLVVLKRAHPPGQVARFQYRAADPGEIVGVWLKGRKLVSVTESDSQGRSCRTVTLPHHIWQLHKWRVVIVQYDHWVEVSVERSAFQGTPVPSSHRIPRSARKLTNELLVLFDRPPILDAVQGR